jgi:hypothetical protein
MRACPVASLLQLGCSPSPAARAGVCVRAAAATNILVSYIMSILTLVYYTISIQLRSCCWRGCVRVCVCVCVCECVCVLCVCVCVCVCGRGRAGLGVSDALRLD